MADPSALVQRLLELARRRFRIAPEKALRPEDDLFRALGIDSVQALDLLGALEQELRVELPDYELRDVRTFAELAEKVAERL